MKKENGITLISLIIYVIIMTFIVAGVSAVTTSFYNSMNEFDKTSESATAFSRFNMYFLNDIKAPGARIVGINNSSNRLEISFRNKTGTLQVVVYEVESRKIV